MKIVISIFILAFTPMCLFAQDLPTFRVQGDQVEGLTPEREQRMRLAMQIFERVMNDKNFQKEILSFPYQYDVEGDPNRVLTPQQVFIKLHEGQEFYLKENNNTANIHWNIKKRHKIPLAPHQAIGYGLPEDITVYTYTWWFDSSDLEFIVGHIAHEWSHKLSFDHLKNPHPGRDNTVPYAFGNIVTRYAKQHLTQ